MVIFLFYLPFSDTLLFFQCLGPCPALLVKLAVGSLAWGIQSPSQSFLLSISLQLPHGSFVTGTEREVVP